MSEFNTCDGKLVATAFPVAYRKAVTESKFLSFKYLFVQLSVCLLLVATNLQVNATVVGTTSITAYSDGRGGGYAAVAEYGPSWVLASVQGDFRKRVTAAATLDYMYDIQLNSQVNVTYSLRIEAQAVNIRYQQLANIDSRASVRIPGKNLFDEARGVFRVNSTANQCWFPNPCRVDITGEFNFQWASTAPMLVGISTSVRGEGEGVRGYAAPGFFSGAAFADPVVTVGGTVINPIEPLATFTRESENVGVITAPRPGSLGPPGSTLNPPITSPADDSAVPEPATLALLALGLVGIGLRRRQVH